MPLPEENAMQVGEENNDHRKIFVQESCARRQHSDVLPLVESPTTTIFKERVMSGSSASEEPAVAQLPGSSSSELSVVMI
uniref:Uncharacterized protein n=1 Tax=Romanomermis culicivorax TaxID=13658 RepID=A0A915KKC7_ROMCU